ncbi:hypothetical protein SIID45300_01061 [Candidatus Magnetaquicoccaceae bacterium FCR-1]|uniref:Major tail protein n=1 Tax=Candidatus Magnetaquiglobus chichijimensis TaxID=3141448 RepID=A0ABQ0C785_9PROT
MTAQAYYYKGAGKVYARRYDNPNDPLRELTNSSELKIGINSKTETIKDYDSPSGGVAASASIIEDADVTLVLHDLNHENLALAYWGTSAAVAAGTVSNEVVTAHKGTLTRLARAGASSVVVKSSDGLTTFASGTDYTVTGAGLIIPDTSTIDDLESLKVSYSHGAQATIEAMTTSAQRLYMLFDGINSVMDGKPRIVDLWCVQFEASKGNDYKGDKPATLQLTGRLLRDDTRTEAGASKFFSETLVY